MEQGSEPGSAQHKNAIVFGSAACHPARRPASVRATCEAIGLARPTYYYQSHRSGSTIAFEQKIVQRLLELREMRPNDGPSEVAGTWLHPPLHLWTAVLDARLS